MKRVLLQRLRAADEDDRGVALVLVIALALTLSLFLIAALELAMGNQAQVVRDQRTTGALGSAEAAVDELLYLLNEDPSYAEFPDLTNPAFTGWAAPSGGAAQGEFHYGFTYDDTDGQGLVTVTATGKVGDEVRTVQATLSRRGFLDYLQLTDIFTIDPIARSDVPLLQDFHTHYCARGLEQWWRDGRSFELPEYEYVLGNPDPQPSGGTVIFGPLENSRRYVRGRLTRDDAIDELRDQGLGANRAQATVIALELFCPAFAYNEGQRIEGPVHSNDAIVIAGTTADEPKFLDAVTTSFRGPDDPQWDALVPGTDPAFTTFGFDYRVDFPPSNRVLETKTDPGEGGCRYVGPTSIELDGDRILVRSPLTDPGTVPAHCRPAGGGMVGGGPVSLTAPAFNGVVYVDAAPGCATGTHPLGMPVPGDVTTYSCTDGDVFVWGSLDRPLTIGAADDVVVVWDVVYGDPREAVLGLIADESVWIYHPVDASDRNLHVLTNDATRAPFGDRQPQRADRFFDSPRIDAAIVTLRSSLSLQNYDKGAPLDSTVRVNGAIASPYNGVTGRIRNGAFVAGYTGKRLVYDERLRYLSPPFFIEPTQSAWRMRSFRELPPPPRCGPTEDPLLDDCLPG